MKLVLFGEKFGAKFFDKFLKANKQCNNCSKCVRECPTGNIYERKGKIKFKFQCVWCMKCIYQCPQNAIKARLFTFVVFKDGYDIKKIISNENIKGNFVNESNKRKYKNFYNYIYKN